MPKGYVMFTDKVKDEAEYEAVIGKRHAAAQSNVAIIGGFEMSTG
jgi:hypothetical protein